MEALRRRKTVKSPIEVGVDDHVAQDFALAKRILTQLKENQESGPLIYTTEEKNKLMQGLSLIHP